MRKLGLATVAGFALTACATLPDDFYAKQSDAYLCQMANNPFSDSARAEQELVSRRGLEWLEQVRATREPYPGAHICTAIYRYGAPIETNRTRWQDGSSAQWVFGFYPLGLLSSSRSEFYVYTDQGDTITAIQW